MSIEAVLDVLVCPACKNRLADGGRGLRCDTCGTSFESTDGVLDLYLSRTPDIDRRRSYLWSDVDLFRGMLKDAVPPNGVVVEVCAGPNIIVPYLLRDLGTPCRYISVGNNPDHLRMQKSGVSDYGFVSVKGDSTAMMIADGAADVVVSHHAINDIWLSKGTDGVLDALQETIRIAAPGGVLIFSHCEMDWDPSTREVSLQQVQEHLASRGRYRFETARGGMQDWLVARS